MQAVFNDFAMQIKEANKIINSAFTSDKSVSENDVLDILKTENLSPYNCNIGELKSVPKMNVTLEPSSGEGVPPSGEAGDGVPPSGEAGDGVLPSGEAGDGVPPSGEAGEDQYLESQDEFYYSEDLESVEKSAKNMVSMQSDIHTEIFDAITIDSQSTYSSQVRMSPLECRHANVTIRMSSLECRH